MTIRDLIPKRWTEKNVPVRRVDDPLLAIQRDFHRLFDELWDDFLVPAGPLGRVFGRGYMPQMDIAETDDGLRVEVELPGMDEKDLDVTISSSALTVRGEKSEEKCDERKDYVFRERSYGSFERTIPLPEGLDIDAAKATFRKGVLTIDLPRTEEARRRSRHIQVEAA